MFNKKFSKAETAFREWFAGYLKDVVPERAKLLKECEEGLRTAFHAGITAKEHDWV